MIDSVEMVNWRAYEQRTVTFEPGITFVMGANGIGKTSILEAIAYALTGEPATVHKTKLLRDPSKLAEVRLQFTLEGTSYFVERSQSATRADKARLVRMSDGVILARNHTQTTQQIEQLMNISADFLQRIVYMSEGDVFRFVDRPPGETVNLQIRQVLGLNQLDAFLEAAKHAKKAVSTQLQALVEILDRLKALGIADDGSFLNRLADLDMQHGALSTQLRDLRESIARQEREHQDIERLKPLLQDSLSVLHPDDEQVADLRQKPVVTLYDRLMQELDQAQRTIQDLRTSLARTEGEETGYHRVLDILEPYAERLETLPCPVCGKPMTQSERERVTSELQDNIRRLRQECADIAARNSQIEQHRQALERQVRGLRELRNFIVHAGFQSVSSESSITDLEQLVFSRENAAQQELAPVMEQCRLLEKQIRDLERDRAEYLAIQKLLQQQRFSSFADLREAAINLEMRGLSIKAAEAAAGETLARQRDVSLADVYDQIARLWEAFLGTERGFWQVQLDSAGMPVLQSRERGFDFSQFSGGQKTALLVLLHTIVARHFSKSDFLLIDEPLEHLDAINRRSLLRFLVDAYRAGVFKQAIITTYEEALIRKYASEDGISVLHLT